MSIADIHQIIIGVVSIIATVGVSVAIYWLQTRKEKEALKEKVNEFLRNNENELDYLPYCVMASNLNAHKKHKRKIYNAFCSCSRNMQKEILKSKNFTIKLIKNNKWTNDCIKSLRKDIKKYNLTYEQDYLYDNAKYFHRGFTIYGKDYYKPSQKYEFPRIYQNELIEKLCDKSEVSLSTYIEQYFDYILDKKNNVSFENLSPNPPIDYIMSVKGVANKDEKEVCYWVMYYVAQIVINIHNRFIKTDYDILYDNTTDAIDEYFEDKYYHTLLWLYTTYCLDKKYHQKRTDT